MNKFVSGCLIVVVVVLIAGGTLAYKFVFKPATEFVSGVMKVQEEIAALNAQIDNQQPYQPAADAEVKPQQLQRFLDARRAMGSTLKERLSILEAKYQAIEQQIESQQEEASIATVVAAFGDMTELIVEAKRVQVQLLNQFEFSLAEYTWVRDRVYTALGAHVGQGMQIGTEGIQTTAPPVDVSDELRAMVEPHKETLMETAVLAFFGM